MIELVVAALLAAVAGETNWQAARSTERLRLRLLGAPPARFVPDQPFDPEQPYSVDGISFDPHNGLGVIGDNRNITYLGFVAWMTPGQFLDLNPERIRPWNWIREEMEAGAVFSPPILYLDETGRCLDWDEGDPPLELQVRSHEGRGRMSAMNTLRPDSLVPVQVVVNHWRARHLAPGALLGATVASDPRRTTSGRPLRLIRITLDRRSYGRPTGL